jgi:hypothetical protein
MTPNRSSRAPKLGELVEDKLRERYDLTRPEEGREPWMDAVGPNGSPWELKGTMRERSNGEPGRFRIFREPHQSLSRADGYYAFGVYRARGRGIQLLESNVVRARAVRFEWGPSEHSSPNREKQKKLSIERAVQL